MCFSIKGWWYGCNSVFTITPPGSGFCKKYCRIMTDIFNLMNSQQKFLVSSEIKFIQWSLSKEESHSTGK